MERKKSRITARVFTLALSLMMVFGLLPATALADSPPQAVILVTSDVHDKTPELQSWVTGVHADVPALNHMIFGGDYTYGSDSAGVSSTCSSIINSVYPGVPIVKARGNHDSSGTYSSGLVYNGSDYAIYAIDLDTSTAAQIISMDKIEALDTALSGLDPSKPVIVVSHYPLHYYTSRTTANAPELVERLNKYPNAIVLWGHNHTLSDPGYGTVKKAGDKIQCASGLSPVEIHFTYVNMGSIYSSVNNAAGVVMTMTKNDGDTVLDFQYKNPAGATSSAYTVTIDTQSIAERPTINTQPQTASVDIGDALSLSVDAVVNDGGTLSFQWYEDDTDDCTGGTEVGENLPTLPVLTQTPGTTYYYCQITNTKDGDTASVTSEAARVRVNSGEAGGVTYEYASAIESGSRYVLVDKSSSDAYALTTESVIVGETAYLVGDPVTVNGSTLNADGIDDSMIWELTTDGSGYNVKNASSFLHRKSGSSGGIYLNTTDEGASYTDWKYNSTTHNLNVYSSGQDKDFYLYQAASGGTYYFANSETPGNSIYLYKVNVTNPVEVGSVAVTGVDEPVPGAAPDTSASTSTAGVVSPAAVSWAPAANPFGYDTAYTASITLSAQYAYEFTSGTTVTINGAPADTVVLNSNGTLTATLAFDKTAAAPLVTYENATSVEGGSTYVIVDKGTPNYALVASVANTDYLAAAEITVNGSTLNPQGITSNMLWTFTTDGSGFNVKNGSNFLTRPSGGGDKITLKTTDDGSANTDWQYDNTNHVLKMKGSSSTYYLLQTGSGTPYFAVASSDSNAKNIYLYKRTETPPTTISSAAVTGIDAPVAGNTPDTTAAVSTAGVTASAVTWTPSATAFGNNTVYTASVRLYPESGYAFAAGATATINGQPAQVVRNTNGSLTASYEFDATTSGPIATISVTDVEAPVAGAVPDLSAATPTAGVILSSVYWNPATNPFDYGAVYTATLTLAAQPGYVFDPAVSVTLNGQAEPVIHNSDGTLTISHAFDATEYGVIDSVQVTDIAAPAAGVAPDVSASVLTPGVTASPVTWLPNDNPFEGDKDYTASVTLTAPIGYVFASGATVTINGLAADVTPGTSGTLIASYTFVKTADEPISSIAVTGIGAPVAVAVPDTTALAATDGVNVSAVTWDPDDNPFDYATVYKASVTLTAQDGYAFASGATVTINGETATVTPGTGGTLIASYTFVKTADEPISSIEVTGIDVPVAAAAPDKTALISTDGVDVSAVTWEPDDNPFDYATAYKASVTLTAQDGYAFASGATVTINGETATVTPGTDGTLIASYTFAATQAAADAQTPNITGQPQDVTVAEGGQANLTVTANVSRGTLTYQWYKNTANDTASGTLISGANAADYSAPTDTIGTLYYYCVVTNTDPDATGVQTAKVTSQACQVIVQTPQYVITAVSNNASYGTVTGGGRYDKGASVTLTASAKKGYSFVCWKKFGTEVSRSLSYTFTALSSASYTAQFAAATALTISCKKTDVSIYGSSNGSVMVTASGGDSGTYEYSINGGTNWQSSGSFSGLAADTYTAAVRDAANPSNIATCAVTVGAPWHMGNVPAKKIPASVDAGNALTIVPPAAPKGYTVVSVTYSSSNPSVASVDANGTLSFIAGGKATIITKVVMQTTDKKGKVKTKTITVKKTVTVTQPVASISLNTTDATIARTQKLKLAASIAPVTASNKKVTWKSSNTKVASVSSSGVVTGKAGGTAIITCTAKDGSGVTASCTITVTPIYPSGIKVSKAALSLKAGKTASLKASVKPSNTDFKTVTWASSNTAVATVDAKGRVKAIAPGTAVISATTSSGQTASCTVTVK